MSNVSGIIKSIQDIMRKDVGVDGDAQRISQLVWMFFLKIFDDREAELELIEDDYESPLPEYLRWRNWAKDPEGITGDALADFVNNQLFPTLKEKLPTHGPAGDRARVIRGVFEDAYNYMKSGTLMRQVINKICEIDFNNTADRHTFGSIYEQILRDLQSAGNAGEFYTPRAVTRFIVNRVDPKLDETVLDPACGTGGFLTCTIDHKRERYVKTRDDEEALVASIRGVEKKALPHMLAVTNMILHGIDTPTQIRHDNTLARPYKDYGNADRVHVIVTNPPFGGMEEDGIENNFPASYRTRETADLFMALIIKLLKDGGRAAVVLPDGFLFGEGMKARLKESLLTECNLHTIVRLPNGVFNPYTGIKTNLLFFTKGQPTEHVWFYEHPYPEGVKSYNKTKPMRFEEFETEIAWWGTEADGFKARVQTEHAWKVPVADIVARNYNLDIKNPHVGEQVSHDPSELLRQHQEQQAAIADLHNQLRAILGDAFNREGGLPRHEVITDSLDLWTSALMTKASVGRGGNGKQEPYGITRLRELILELAVRGKLVPQDSNGEPASVLLERIAKEKKRLVEEGVVRKNRTMPEVSEDEKPYQIPKSWEWVRLTDLYYSISPSGKKLKSSEVLEQGVHPVVDQGQAYIAGYTNDSELLITIPGPVVIFGDHTTELKYVDFDFVAGADGTKILRPYLMSERYFYTYLTSYKLENRGYARHFKVLNDNLMALPPLAEQDRIVAKVHELMTLCDALSAILQDSQTTLVHLADAVVEQAVA